MAIALGNLNHDNIHVVVIEIYSTVKPVLSSHSKIDITKILMTNGSLMKVKSIAECSTWHYAILLTCFKR